MKKTLTLHNGDKIPALGLGTWKSDDKTYPAIRSAIQIGYRHIDCALRYENEEEVGRGIKDAITAGEVSRDEIWVTSKLWNNAHQRKHVRPALELSLKNLGVDFLDLYLIHWPVALRPEVIFPDKGEDFLALDEAPIIETWQAMEDCVSAGLCRNIGVSNFSIQKIEALQAHAAIKPSVNQVELHPFLQQNDLLKYCIDNAIVLTGYSPLGSMDRPERLHLDGEPTLLDHPDIVQMAGDHRCTPAQVLISWALQRRTSVIPKSSNPQRLKENFEAQEIHLADSDMERIGKMDRHYRYIHGTFWTIEGSPYTIENLWDEG